ncbi:MAG TPA: hypothetical protein VNN74_06085 [Candidatus Micrarchaeia archaeon]|nr:hypothetical protein [Candidatus Micrarchaeia archaeon]
MADVSELIAAIEADPALRAAVRRAILTDDLLALPAVVEARFEQVETQLARLVEAQARTEAQVTRLVEAQARTEAQVTTLVEAQARTEAQLARLVEAQARTEAQVATLAEALVRTQEHIDRLAQGQAVLQIDVADLKGAALEARFRELAQSYLYGLVGGVRRLRAVDRDQLTDLAADAEARGAISLDEGRDLLAADAVVRGLRADGQAPLYIVVEVSWGVGPGDVERAQRRADLLQRAGVEAVAVVAGTAITTEAASLASRIGVPYRAMTIKRAPIPA